MKSLLKVVLRVFEFMFFSSSFPAELIVQPSDTLSQAKARTWLRHARNLLSDNTVNVNYVRKFAKEAHATLEDIGTSESELNELLIGGYKAEARTWLRHARNLLSDNTVYVNYVRKFAKEAHATLEDIGTSDKELGELE